MKHVAEQGRPCRLACICIHSMRRSLPLRCRCANVNATLSRYIEHIINENIQCCGTAHCIVLETLS